MDLEEGLVVLIDVAFITSQKWSSSYSICFRWCENGVGVFMDIEFICAQ